MTNKRKNDDAERPNREKKSKNNTETARNPKEKTTLEATPRASDTPADQLGLPRKSDAQSNPSRRPRIRKLAPSRPFPTVGQSSSATGPRSAHREGKNCICITRKTKLAAYLRRCKDLLVDDGFKELKLSAMGAAIPHLALLVVSLPPTLPWAENEVHVEVFTGSLEVYDELLSESGDEAEDRDPPEELRARVKSTMNIVIRIGQVETSDKPVRDPVPCSANKVEKEIEKGKRVLERGVPEQIILQEPDQDDMQT